MKPAKLITLLNTLLIILIVNGCAMVGVSSLSPGEYIALKRGDLLTSGELSAATQETIKVIGLDEGRCREHSQNCVDILSSTAGIAEERRLSALAELWLQEAMSKAGSSSDIPSTEADIYAWIEVARHAYAYLFFSERSPGERAFEDRQIQVRDYYNYSVQQIVSGLFQQNLSAIEDKSRSYSLDTPRLSGWKVTTDLTGVRFAGDIDLPENLVPASSLVFSGLRSTYRRDGFGAELVAVLDDSLALHRARPYSEMPFPALTALIHFSGEDLAQVLSTQSLEVIVRDPYQDDSIQLHGQQIPLAANFTAGYGLWLAHSGFSRQAIRSLLGHSQGINRPHLYMMQPFDPERRIILMLHGLGSSPEAWVNVANEVLGDESLRQHFQVWQIYYPTNMPLSINHTAIRRTVNETLLELDPTTETLASQGIVLIGHSMGGVLARLMVSSSQGRLWSEFVEQRQLPKAHRQLAQQRLAPLLRFESLPEIKRAIFIAAPHRGTPVAGNRLGRAVSRFVRLPLTLLEEFDDVIRALANTDAESDGAYLRLPNSIDNLSEADPFIRATANLPISPQVHYHSIIAQRDTSVPLEVSDDGIVPYASAHLPGAISEKVFIAGHSVQETAQAILEIRRILHQDLTEYSN
ncbi:hypothetical protein CXF87_06150 [Halomonas sp. MES3-P3E]|nr:hypothetical protein CXF87_06150 [Halomonas sp. MES3-P3E]